MLKKTLLPVIKSKTKHISRGDILIIIILSIGSFAIIIPLWWMIVTSLDWKSVMRMPFPPRLWPAQLSFKPYVMCFTNVPMFRYILNSLVIATGTIIISFISVLMSGYALSKIPFHGRAVWLLIILSIIMIPFEVIMLPQYFLMNRLKLLNTYWAFYLPAICYPFGTFLMKQYIDKLPIELREAAMIDGENEAGILFKIYLPLCGPISATFIILTFLGSWNDFLWPLLVLSNQEMYTVQIGIAMFRYNANMQLPAVLMAGSVVSFIPLVIIYITLQKYIIESIHMQGLKQ